MLSIYQNLQSSSLHLYSQQSFLSKSITIPHKHTLISITIQICNYRFRSKLTKSISSEKISYKSSMYSCTSNTACFANSETEVELRVVIISSLKPGSMRIDPSCWNVMMIPMAAQTIKKISRFLI